MHGFALCELVAVNVVSVIDCSIRLTIVDPVHQKGDSTRGFSVRLPDHCISSAFFPIGTEAFLEVRRLRDEDVFVRSEFDFLRSNNDGYDGRLSEAGYRVSILVGTANVPQSLPLCIRGAAFSSVVVGA